MLCLTSCSCTCVDFTKFSFVVCDMYMLCAGAVAVVWRSRQFIQQATANSCHVESDTGAGQVLPPVVNLGDPWTK